MANIDKVTLNGTNYTIVDSTVPSWAKSATKPSYTASEVGAVPTTRTVNGKALSSNITLSASDVGALPNNTHIPADQVQSNWNETDTSSKAYIQNKPTIPDTSTLATKTELNAKQDKINDLAAIRSGAGKGATSVQTISVNDASLSPTDGNISISVVTGLQFDGSSHVGAVQLPEYVKKSDYDTTIDDIYQSIPSDLADLADDKNHRLVTEAEKSRWNYKQNAIGDLATIRSGASKGATAIQPADLAAVATSGSYNDLTDKPVIPEGADLSGYYTKTEIDTKIGNIETLLASI